MTSLGNTKITDTVTLDVASPKTHASYLDSSSKLIEQSGKLEANVNKDVDTKVELAPVRPLHETVMSLNEAPTVKIEPALQESDDVSKSASHGQRKRKSRVCTVCQREFSTRRAMLHHLRTHSGEKPFACPHCQKKFTSRGNMTKHTRIHTGIKPYSCHLCAKTFSESGDGLIEQGDFDSTRAF